MKFKIAKTTETFKKLAEFKKQVESVNTQAGKLSKELGGTGRYCKKIHRLAGGVSGIEFKQKPEGFKVVGEPYQNLYYPKVTNKTACKQIEALPTLEYNALNSIIGFKSPQTVSADRGIVWINAPSVIWGKNEMLLDIESGCKYTPPSKDIVEILESEYEKLKNKIVESKKSIKSKT